MRINIAPYFVGVVLVVCSLSVPAVATTVSVSTVPEGFMTFSLPATGAGINSITYLSLPLTDEPVYTGAVSSTTAVTATTIAVDDSPAPWTAGAFTTTLYFVKFLSGSEAGRIIKITGRKKDIIITAGGKNITPANLEAEIRQHQLVSQCVVVGDRRPYLVALVTLDPEEAVAYAKEHGLPEDPAQLAANPEIRKVIEDHVEEINKKFARVEQVKKISILPRDLTQESGELTPTLKVKRNIIDARYGKVIDELYRSG